MHVMGGFPIAPQTPFGPKWRSLDLLQAPLFFH